MNDDQPIAPDSPLGRLLAADKAPALSAGFADRVLARTADRALPLPPVRKGSGGAKRWRSARRFAIGTVVAGALATTAAATGLLGDLPISVPSVERVWATITGQDDSEEPAQMPVSNEVVPPPPEIEAPVEIEGPIDSPEELEEAFRRVDEVRSNRSNVRQERFDQRLDRVINRRRDQGLRVPTPEQEERLRERIDKFREQRDERVEERLETRRDELRERVESGEELTREDFIREQRDAVGRPGRRDRLERLREMSPEERRDAIRQFREQRRERRRERIQQELAPSDPPETATGTETSDPDGTTDQNIDR